MPEGRGSLSGRNQWPAEYVPGFGATGKFRQAGPLSPDVATVMEQVKDAIVEKPAIRGRR